MLERFDNTTVTKITGEKLTIQEYAKECSEYLIEKLKDFQDSYSNLLKETLKKNLGAKWSVIRKALDELCENDKVIEYDLSFQIVFYDIVYPNTDQDEEL